MTLGLLGAFVGLLFGAGLLLVVDALRVERPTLALRVLPYVPEVAWYLQHDTVGTVRRRGRRAGAAPGQAGSAGADLWGARLLWGGVALTAAAAVWFLLGGDVIAHPGVLVTVSVAALVLGAASRDVVLAIQGRRRVERAGRELPLAAELLWTSAAAGLGPDEALRRCAVEMSGALAADLAGVVRAVEDGVSLPRALEVLADAAVQPQVSEFLFGMAVALDRGTPLADVLGSQTLDVRTVRGRGLARSERRRGWIVLATAALVGAVTTVVVLAWSGTVDWSLGSGWPLR